MFSQRTLIFLPEVFTNFDLSCPMTDSGIPTFLNYGSLEVPLAQRAHWLGQQHGRAVLRGGDIYLL